MSCSVYDHWTVQVRVEVRTPYRPTTVLVRTRNQKFSAPTVQAVPMDVAKSIVASAIVTVYVCYTLQHS